jgi:hypothetical protein
MPAHKRKFRDPPPVLEADNLPPGVPYYARSAYGFLKYLREKSPQYYLVKSHYPGLGSTNRLIIARAGFRLCDRPATARMLMQTPLALDLDGAITSGPDFLNYFRLGWLMRMALNAGNEDLAIEIRAAIHKAALDIPGLKDGTMAPWSTETLWLFI